MVSIMNKFLLSLLVSINFIAGSAYGMDEEKPRQLLKVKFKPAPTSDQPNEARFTFSNSPHPLEINFSEIEKKLGGAEANKHPIKVYIEYKEEERLAYCKFLLTHTQDKVCFNEMTCGSVKGAAVIFPDNQNVEMSFRYPSLPFLKIRGAQHFTLVGTPYFRNLTIETTPTVLVKKLGNHLDHHSPLTLNCLKSQKVIFQDTDFSQLQKISFFAPEAKIKFQCTINKQSDGSIRFGDS